MFRARSTRISPLAPLVALIALATVPASPARATMPTAAGTLPAEVREAFESGVLELPARAEPLGTSAVQSQWRVPILMIGFADMPLTYSPASFDHMLFDTTGSTAAGSASEYYDWVSEGRLRLSGKVVLAVQLPRPREYYAYNAYGLNTISTPNNIFGMIRDALEQARDAGIQVDWSHYDLDNDGVVDMLWVVHAGEGGETTPEDRNNVWSITSRMSAGWRNGSWFETDDYVPGSTTQKIRIDRFSTVPELSGRVQGAISEIGVYCHEFGHALGLPDLYDTSVLGGAANAGPGNWSLMATGSYGANGVTPESPSHLGAWPMLFLGWRQAVRPAADADLTLLPLAEGGDIVEAWFQGEASSEHFLIENRQPLGFDRHLPGRGMILYQVDEVAIGTRLQANRINAGLTPGLRLVEADGDSDLVVGRNRGDGLDAFPGPLQRRRIDEDTSPSTRTFLGRPTNVAMEDIRLEGYDLRLSLRIEAPGWLPREDRTTADFAPIENGSLPALFRDDRDVTHVVQSELRGGRAQVVLRSSQKDIWAPSVQVSQTGGVALDPTGVAVPGGDLAIVWSDTRHGAARLYYRARIRGAWTAEHMLTALPGDARNPAMRLAPDGTIHLAWLQVAPVSRIMFMRFLYTSPFGSMHAVTDSTQPGPPSLAVRPDGGSYIMWSDRVTLPAQLKFARFHADSGVSNVLPLVPLSFGAQAAPSGGFDSQGTLHLVWTETSSGLNRIRYQQRQAYGFPNPPDQTIVQHGNSVSSPLLGVAPDGSAHMAYVRTHEGIQMARYMRHRQGYGWDLIGTNLTAVEEGDIALTGVLPDDRDHVTVFYTGHPAGAPRLNLRRRSLGSAPPVAIDVPSPARTGLRLAPNPIRAGMEFAIELPGAGAEGPVDVFDLAGRRVATAFLGAEGIPGRARFRAEGTSRWEAGVYFVRVRDGSASARIVVLR